MINPSASPSLFLSPEASFDPRGSAWLGGLGGFVQRVFGVAPAS